MASWSPPGSQTAPLLGALASLAFLPILGLQVHQTGAASPLVEAPPPPAPTLAAVASDDPVERALDALDATAKVRFFALDLSRGAVVAARRPDERADPLATADVLTAAAALARLHPEHRFKTIYWGLGRVKGGVLWGDLVVQGFGDPTVDEVRLMWVAKELALGGIERIYGSIRLDDSFFREGAPQALDAVEEEEEGEGAPAEEGEDELDAGTLPASDAGAAEEEVPVLEGPSSLLFAHNRARLQLTPTLPGSRAELLVDPDVGFVQVFPWVETARFGRRLRSSVEHSPDATSVVLTGAIAASEGPRTLYVDVDDGAFYFGRALWTHLRKNGIKVRSTLARAPRAGRRRWILSDFSPPLLEVVAEMLHGDVPDRGRLYAQTILRSLGVQATGDRGTVSTGLAALGSFLEEAGVKPGTYKLAAPGEPGGEVAPRQFVQVLRAMHDRFELHSEFERVMGAGETQRLLVQEIGEPALLRQLRAVVDTAPGQIAVVGYVTGPRRPIAFALLVDGARDAPAVLWEKQARLFEALAEKAGGRAPAPGASPRDDLDDD